MRFGSGWSSDGSFLFGGITVRLSKDFRLDANVEVVYCDRWYSGSVVNQRGVGVAAGTGNCPVTMECASRADFVGTIKWAAQALLDNRCAFN